MSHSDRAVRHIGHRRRPSGCRFAYPFPDTPLTCLRHPIGNQDDEREALQLAARQHEATVNAAKAAVQGRNRTGRNAASIVRELETRLAAVIAEKQELASSLMRTLAECTRARDDAAAAREALNVVREAGERAATALEVEESARRRDAEHAKAAAEMHSTALASAHAEIDNLRRGHAEIMAATDAEVERLCVRNRTVEAALVKAEKSLNEQETMLKEAKQRASQTSEELRCEHDRVLNDALLRTKRAEEGSSAAAVEVSRLSQALAASEEKVAEALREAAGANAAQRVAESAEAAREAAEVTAKELRRELREVREAARKSIREAEDAADEAISNKTASDEALRQAKLAHDIRTHSERKERDEKFERLKKEYDAALMTAMNSQLRAVEEAVAVSEANHANIVAALEARHEQQMGSLAEQHKEELVAAIDAATMNVDDARRAGYDAAIAEATAAEDAVKMAHQSMVADLTRNHTVEMHEARMAHEEEMKKLATAQTNLIDKMRTEHAAELAKAVKKAETSASAHTFAVESTRADAAAAAHAAEKELLLEECDQRMRRLIEESNRYRNAMDSAEEACRELNRDIAARDAQLEAHSAEVAALEVRLAAAVAECEKHAKAAAAARAERILVKEKEQPLLVPSLQQREKKQTKLRQRGGGLKVRDVNVVLSPTKMNNIAFAAEKALVSLGQSKIKAKVATVDSKLDVQHSAASSWDVALGYEGTGKLHSNLLFGLM